MRTIKGRIANTLLTSSLVLGFASSGLLGGCAGSGSATAKESAAKQSLYERLGGRQAISTVVDRFVAKTAADPRISARFANVDAPHLRAAMVDHISEATGGPFKYTGKDMRAAHTGMKITAEEFAAFMEDLEATLNEVGVPAREKKEVLAFFTSLRLDTIGQ